MLTTPPPPLILLPFAISMYRNVFSVKTWIFQRMKYLPPSQSDRKHKQQMDHHGEIESGVAVCRFRDVTIYKCIYLFCMLNFHHRAFIIWQCLFFQIVGIVSPASRIIITFNMLFFIRCSLWILFRFPPIYSYFIQFIFFRTDFLIFNIKLHLNVY